jgi:putative hemolysin
VNGLGLSMAIGGALVGGYFSALQMSLRVASRGRLRELAGKSPSRLRRVEVIIEHDHSHTLAVSLVRVACNLLVVIGLLVWLTGLGEASRVTWGALATAAGLAALAVYIMSVVLPTSVADHMGESLVARHSTMIRATNRLLWPLVRVVRFVDVVIRRLAGAEEQSPVEEIEREIRSVVSEGESEGSLNEAERDMIEAVVDLRAKVVSETMTPRTEIEGFELTDDLGFIRAFIEKAGHSRIPVYEGDHDHIVGLLYAKDLLKYLGEDTTKFKLRPVLRKAWFVPETKPIIELLSEFQRESVHLAIVLDEYGGTAGLVTIEDVVEEIVGEIRDEYEPVDEQEPEIRVLAEERAAEIDARAYIDDVNDMLDDVLGEGEVSLPEGEEYDTVGGFVMTALGHIPQAGEEFRKNGFLVKILEAEPTRVRRVRIEFDLPTEAGEQSPETPGGEPAPAK